MAIAIGPLTERVTIQSKATTDDGQGGRTKTWSTLATVWARVEPLRATERIQAAAIGASLGYRVHLRYRDDVTEKMRVSWRPYKRATAKTLEIHSVTPAKGQRELLELECGEVV